MIGLIRLNDATDHRGEVVTVSDTMHYGGRRVARDGDLCRMSAASGEARSRQHSSVLASNSRRRHPAHHHHNSLPSRSRQHPPASGLPA
ncbi:PAAR domain-containing protein [Paraburkholderia caledonica]|jgi:hypothetical protein